MKIFSSLILGLVVVTIPMAPALAQITVDGTTNTTLTPIDNGVRIDGDSRAEGNLFHSFREFSVLNGRVAFFNNAADIVNIFSRVTGGNISNINGLLRANGNANLFLLNPAGIILGENARLNIGGSFFGTTADSIIFSDGEFSATDLDNPPLLTINAPIGLNFRDNPGDITVRGDGKGTRLNTDLIDTENALRVNENSTFALIGGNLNLQGATIKTIGGRIELGSVGENEQLALTPTNKGWTIDYQGVDQFRNLQLSETAIVDASGLRSGDIQIAANKITLTDGSQIESSLIGNQIEASGNVNITAIDSISFDGEDQNGFNSGVFSEVYSGAIGNAGDINITTGSLSVTNGAIISTIISGQGNAGSVIITATDEIFFDGEGRDNISGAFSRVGSGAEGSAGDVSITTDLLSITNGAQISASTFGRGNAGSVTITTTDSISLDGEGQNNNPSGIFSQVNSGAEVNAGGIDITTGSLSVTNGALISASAFSEQGNAGSITITATDSISLDNQSQIITVARSQTGGNINLNVKNILQLENNSTISAQAFNEAIGGNININSDFIIAFPSNFEGDGNDIRADALRGNGGNIKITAEALFNIENRPAIDGNQTNDIDASSQFGLDGTISISTPDTNTLQTDIELPNNVVESEPLGTNACTRRGVIEASSLIVKGKGGLPALPSEPLDSDDILVGEQNTTPNLQTQSPEIKPITTSIGDIYPARGIIKTEDGKVILTSYPTDNINTRTPHISANCSSLLKDEESSY